MNQGYVYLTAAEIDGAALNVQRVKVKVHITFNDHSRPRKWIALEISRHESALMDFKLPNGDPEGGVGVEADGGHFLEHVHQPHVPQLPDVEVRHPERVPLFPGQLQLLPVGGQVHARVLPVHLQEYVDCDLLQIYRKALF